MPVSRAALPLLVLLVLSISCASGRQLAGPDAVSDGAGSDDRLSLLSAPVDPSTLSTVVTGEIRHVIRAQVDDATDPSYGVINDVYGPPTWVVPGDMAVATLMLWKAGYVAEARAACDYLARVQGADGSWANQYDHDQLSPSSNGWFTRMTAEVAITLAVVDRGKYEPNLERAVAWLSRLMDPAIKGGNDDGLLGGGFDRTGAVIGDRWASDNSYAVILFDLVGRIDLRDRVLAGIEHVLAQPDRWMRSAHGDGTAAVAPFDWIDFAPAQMNLARFGVAYPAQLASTI